jgi:hypothetical protein
MTENKMYVDRVRNVPVMRYCNFNCVYCSFKKFLKLSKCQDCKDNKNHTHLEVLQRIPPKTNRGQFLTVGLSGDVSFMNQNEFAVVLGYCHDWNSRTFLIQSKNPEYFLQFSHMIPQNVIIGTTIETNRSKFDCHTDTDFKKYVYRDYSEISQAPYPIDRYTPMLNIKSRKAVTVEPILDFDLDIFVQRIKEIAPEFVYIGYANDHKAGIKLKLPEPTIEKTMQLINELKRDGIDVREKTLRKAYYE